MGVRKPDLEIFKMVLKEGQFDPEEVAFIDDLIDNVEAADAAGITGIHLPPGKEIMDLFDEKLELVFPSTIRLNHYHLPFFLSVHFFARPKKRTKERAPLTRSSIIAWYFNFA